MRSVNVLNNSDLFIEMGLDSLKLLTRDDDGLEIPISRSENGRLTDESKQAAIASIRTFLAEHGNPQNALCAIPARGVSLRKITLPLASGEDFERLLLFQIEKEFPLAPDELAWGYQEVEEPTGARTELLVVATKKETLAEYSELLEACGLESSFTVAALARDYLCDHSAINYSILELGTMESELISFENGTPTMIRVIGWGTNDFPQPQTIVEILSGKNPGQKLYLSGNKPREAAALLEEFVGGSTIWTVLDFPRGQGRSTATLGLKKAAEDSSPPPIVLELHSTVSNERTSAHWRWAATAAALLAIWIALRYAEIAVGKHRLSATLAELKAHRDKLPNLDNELGLLQYLKTNQPAYLDIIHTLAQSAPRGTRFDSLSVNRRGDLSLKGGMANAEQVVELRSKLIDSGFFSNVVVEEQTPTPDRQKVIVRISAQCKANPDRKVQTPKSMEKDTPNGGTNQGKAGPYKVAAKGSPE
jgi:hypothetical protein